MNPQDKDLNRVFTTMYHAPHIQPTSHKVLRDP